MSLDSVGLDDALEQLTAKAERLLSSDLVRISTTLPSLPQLLTVNAADPQPNASKPRSGGGIPSDVQSAMITDFLHTLVFAQPRSSLLGGRSAASPRRPQRGEEEDCTATGEFALVQVARWLQLAISSSSSGNSSLPSYPLVAKHLLEAGQQQQSATTPATRSAGADDEDVGVILQHMSRQVDHIVTQAQAGVRAGGGGGGGGTLPSVEAGFRAIAAMKQQLRWHFLNQVQPVQQFYEDLVLPVLECAQRSIAERVALKGSCHSKVGSDAAHTSTTAMMCPSTVSLQSVLCFLANVQKQVHQCVAVEGIENDVLEAAQAVGEGLKWHGDQMLRRLVPQLLPDKSIRPKGSQERSTPPKKGKVVPLEATTLSPSLAERIENLRLLVTYFDDREKEDHTSRDHHPSPPSQHAIIQSMVQLWDRRVASEPRSGGVDGKSLSGSSCDRHQQRYRQYHDALLHEIPELLSVSDQFIRVLMDGVQMEFTFLQETISMMDSFVQRLGEAELDLMQVWWEQNTAFHKGDEVIRRDEEESWRLLQAEWAACVRTAIPCPVQSGNHHLNRAQGNNNPTTPSRWFEAPDTDDEEEKDVDSRSKANNSKNVVGTAPPLLLSPSSEVVAPEPPLEHPGIEFLLRSLDSFEAVHKLHLSLTGTWWSHWRAFAMCLAASLVVQHADIAVPFTNDEVHFLRLQLEKRFEQKGIPLPPTLLVEFSCVVHHFFRLVAVMSIDNEGTAVDADRHVVITDVLCSVQHPLVRSDPSADSNAVCPLTLCAWGSVYDALRFDLLCSGELDRANAASNQHSSSALHNTSATSEHSISSTVEGELFVSQSISFLQLSSLRVGRPATDHKEWVTVSLWYRRTAPRPLQSCEEILVDLRNRNDELDSVEIRTKIIPLFLKGFAKLEKAFHETAEGETVSERKWYKRVFADAFQGYAHALCGSWTAAVQTVPLTTVAFISREALQDRKNAAVLFFLPPAALAIRRAAHFFFQECSTPEKGMPAVWPSGPVSLLQRSQLWQRVVLSMDDESSSLSSQRRAFQVEPMLMYWRRRTQQPAGGGGAARIKSQHIHSAMVTQLAVSLQRLALFGTPPLRAYGDAAEAVLEAMIVGSPPSEESPSELTVLHLWEYVNRPHSQEGEATAPRCSVSASSIVGQATTTPAVHTESRLQLPLVVSSQETTLPDSSNVAMGTMEALPISERSSSVGGVKIANLNASKRRWTDDATPLLHRTEEFAACPSPVSVAYSPTQSDDGSVARTPEPGTSVRVKPMMPLMSPNGSSATPRHQQLARQPSPPTFVASSVPRAVGGIAGFASSAPFSASVTPPPRLFSQSPDDARGVAHSGAFVPSSSTATPSLASRLLHPYLTQTTPAHTDPNSVEKSASRRTPNAPRAASPIQSRSTASTTTPTRSSAVRRSSPHVAARTAQRRLPSAASRPLSVAATNTTASSYVARKMQQPAMLQTPSTGIGK